MTKTIKTIPKLRFPEFRNAPEWEEKPLSKVGEIVTGNTPSTANTDNYGGNKLFVSPADISEKRYVISTKTTLSEQGFEETRHIKANSILFVCIGSTIGKVAQNKFECATNQQINSIIPFTEYSNDFVYSALENSSPKIALLAGNHAVPIINKTLFSSVKILVPDFQEQQKIADCLSSVDELITAQSAKVEALKAHKKALMQQLFPAEGETTPRLRFPEFRDAPEWEENSINNFVDKNILCKPLDGNHGNIHPKSSDFVKTGIPFVMANDIKNGQINLENSHKITKKQADSLQKGFSYTDDVLLTHKGSIGQTAIVPKLDTEYIMLTPQVTYYRVKDRNKLSNKFLLHVFQSSNFQKMLDSFSGGGTRAYVGITEQRNLKINYPLSLEEQQKIADCLSSIDELITAQSAKVEALKTHKKALMQQLFPQDKER